MVEKYTGYGIQAGIFCPRVYTTKSGHKMPNLYKAYVTSGTTSYVDIFKFFSDKLILLGITSHFYLQRFKASYTAHNSLNKQVNCKLSQQRL